MSKNKKVSKSIMNRRFRKKLKRKNRNFEKKVLQIQRADFQPKRTIRKVEINKIQSLNYKQKIKYFITKKIINEDDVYDYTEDKNFEEYEATFQYYQKNLELQSKYNIENCIYYFDKDDSFNASAKKKENHNLIKIHKGLMVHMMNMFKNNPELLNHLDLSDYSEFEDIIDVPNHIFMYQNASHFVFYHELGHLIQFNNLEEKTVQEELSNVGDFNLSKHIGEMDADEFAGISMASHISQYFAKYKNVERADRLLTNLVVLVISSIILYILSFPTNRISLYYKEGTHPHPVIRVLSVSFTIISHLKELLLYHNIEIGLNHIEVFKESLKISQIIETEQWGSSLCNMFNDNVENNLEEIWAYITELNEIRKDSEETAVYKRNRVTGEIHK